ncbi:MAG: phosphatase PAP2 family protein [Caldisericia bacterium]|nr:phosphatase PAP2 family protein [Caldisericia bacterium]
MFEFNILKFFENIRTPFLNKIFIFITDLGSFEFYLLTISFIFFIFNNRISLKIVFLLFISFSINTIIKNILKLPRPSAEIFNPIYEKSIGKEEFGFPSGHSQNSVVFWFSLFKIFKKKILLILSILMVSLISISRLYLSLHFVLDIIGGITIGFIVLFLFFDFVDNLIKKFLKDKFSYFIPILLFIFSFLIKEYSNLLSPFSGLLLGTLFYREQEDKNLNIKNIFLRELIGLTTLLILIYISSFIYNILFLYILYLILGLWVSYISKIVFQKIKI